MLKRMILVAIVAASVGMGSVSAAEPTSTSVPVKVLLDQGKLLIKDNKLDDAAACYEAVVKLDPKNVEAMYRLSWIYNDKDDFDLGVKWANAALDEDANHTDAWTELGYAQMKQGKHQRAVRSLKEAIKIDPENQSAHKYLISSLKALGKADEADEWQVKLDNLVAGK